MKVVLATLVMVALYSDVKRCSLVETEFLILMNNATLLDRMIAMPIVLVLLDLKKISLPLDAELFVETVFLTRTKNVTL